MIMMVTMLLIIYLCQGKKLREACIIHLCDDKSDLVTPKDLLSWESLLKAAKIRSYVPLLEVANQKPGQIPEVFYHRQCRCRFTLKRDLEKIQSKQLQEPAGNHSYVTNENVRPARKISASRLYSSICIFLDDSRIIGMLST